MITYNIPQQLNIFIGYQFNSEFYPKDQLVSIVQNCCAVASDNLNKREDFQNTKLKVESHDFHLKIGEVINHSIHRQIKESDICIFEISDNNPNVLYEAGFAVGLKKNVIYISHNNSVRKIASDISGVGIATYEEINKLGDSLIIEIEKSIINFIDSQSVVDLFWKFTERPTTAYLGKDKSSFSIGDLKSLELIRANIKNHQNIVIGIDQKFEDQLARNIIIVGGPKSNPYFQKIYFLQNKTEYKICKVSDLKTKNKWCITKNDNPYCYTNYTHELSDEINDFDYALVYLTQNPLDWSTKWICFSGLTRISTIEAIRCFIDEEKLTDILNRINYDPDFDYSLILKFGISNGSSYGSELIDFKKITPANN